MEAKGIRLDFVGEVHSGELHSKVAVNTAAVSISRCRRIPDAQGGITPSAIPVPPCDVNRWHWPRIIKPAQQPEKRSPTSAIACHDNWKPRGGHRRSSWARPALQRLRRSVPARPLRFAWFNGERGAGVYENLVADTIDLISCPGLVSWLISVSVPAKAHIHGAVHHYELGPGRFDYLSSAHIAQFGDEVPVAQGRHWRGNTSNCLDTCGIGVGM